jgi:N6-adenosine-specific RNA methylase IME4
VTEPARVLVADPPWKFGDGISAVTRGAARHYETLSIDRIANFTLPPLADDAALFLWRVAGGTGAKRDKWLAERAFDVIRAWGFSYKTEIVWAKRSICARCKGSGWVNVKIHAEQLAIAQTVGSKLVYSHRGVAYCPRCEGRGSLPWFGMGRYTRGAHETCLLATRGKPELLARNVRSLFEAPVPRRGKEKGAHSAKPPEFRKLVESLFAGPYVELFARGTPPPGWTFFGNQAAPGAAPGEASDAAR